MHPDDVGNRPPGSPLDRTDQMRKTGRAPCRQTEKCYLTGSAMQPNASIAAWRYLFLQGPNGFRRAFADRVAHRVDFASRSPVKCV